MIPETETFWKWLEIEKLTDVEDEELDRLQKNFNRTVLPEEELEEILDEKGEASYIQIGNKIYGI